MSYRSAENKLICNFYVTAQNSDFKHYFRFHGDVPSVRVPLFCDARYNVEFYSL